MSLQFQLSDLRSDIAIRGVSQVCNDTAAFRSQINTVIRQLLKRGAWYGTEVLEKLCVYGCHVVFPRHVGTVLGARMVNGFVPIHNNWYQIVGGSDCCNGFNANTQLVDDGQAPIYRQITGTTGKQIAYHVVKNTDVGKTVKVYGTFYGGQPIQELVDGVWEDGITIVATQAGGAVLPAMTPAAKLITKITHVVKQPTSGMSYLYSYGPDADDNDVLVDLGMYEPNETNPMYRRMKIQGMCGQPGVEDDYGRTRRTIDCMVKLEFAPLVNDYDFLLIDDFDAIRYGIQAYNSDMAGDAAGAEPFWTKAVRELNMLDRQKTPFRQTSVRVRTGAGFVANPI